MTGNNCGGRRADVPTILADFHCLQVLLLPIREQLRTVVRAAMALNLTVRAGLSALVEVLTVRSVILIAWRSGSRPCGEQGDSASPQRAHQLSTIHD